MPTAENTTGYYPARLALRVPVEMQAALLIAAKMQLTSPSEYLRRAVLLALRTDGVRLGADGHVEAQREVLAR